MHDNSFMTIHSWQFILTIHLDNSFLTNAFLFFDNYIFLTHFQNPGNNALLNEAAWVPHVRVWLNTMPAVVSRNPVLVETMWHSLPIVSFDVNFNRHTTHGEALFFSNKEELISCLNSITREWLDETALKVHLVAVKEYSWSGICKRYHDVLTKEYK